MSRRLEVELTSKREDGTFTWRAVGAKQPKGDLDGSLLYDGADVGDVVRADADFGIDGVTITAVSPPKQKRAMPEMIEVVGSGKSDGGVTTQLIGKRGRGDRGDRQDRNDRGDRDSKRGRPRSNRKEGDSRRDGGDGKPAGGGQKRGRHDRGRPDRGSKRESTKPAPKPRAKRLRPRRTHRDALLKELPDIQRPLARVVLRDGVPGLRQLVEKQNASARTKSEPEIPPKILEAVGERMLPRLRTAEWRDNAEAALAGIAEIDIRDIRKVVVAAENGAKDEEARALAEQLRSGLTARVDAEHGKWLSELAQLLQEGRTVRALRQSSHPPKAGAPLPSDLAERLAQAANSSMTPDTSSERWATVLDAVAFSPVRSHVKPVGLPSKVTDELRSTVKKLSKRVPEIASLFAPADAPATPSGTAAAKPAPRIPAPPAIAETQSNPPTPSDAA